MKGVFSPSVPSPGIVFADVYVLGNKAFAADAYGKLWIVDVANPASPAELGKYTGIPGNPQGIFVKDGLAYVASGSTGLFIFDVTDPSSITQVGRYDTAGNALDVVVSENFAFIADERNQYGPEGIKVIDVTNPASPTEVASNNLPGKAWKLAVQGQYIYVADSQNGLFIFKYSPLPPTAPTPFLDLPWDYEAEGLSFSEAATAIGSYFDHEYPFGDVGSVLSEPVEAQKSVTNYQGYFRNLNINYSSHDGYDWLVKAGVHNGDPVLAAASGLASFYQPIIPVMA